MTMILTDYIQFLEEILVTFTMSLGKNLTQDLIFIG